MQSTTQTLKALIQLSRLSQKEYSNKHNINHKQVNHWCTGHNKIPIDKLQKLAFDDGFKINVEYSIINL